MEEDEGGPHGEEKTEASVETSPFLFHHSETPSSTHSTGTYFFLLFCPVKVLFLVTGTLSRRLKLLPTQPVVPSPSLYAP